MPIFLNLLSVLQGWENIISLWWEDIEVGELANGDKGFKLENSKQLYSSTMNPGLQ
jgi:hypothetical protein